MSAGVRILIVRHGALGDTVFTEPVVSAFRAAWPNAYIELVGRTDYLPLLVGSGLADTFRSMDSAEFRALFTDDPLGLPKFDIVLVYLPDSDGSIKAKLRTFTARAVVFDPRPGPCSSIHITDHLLEPVRMLGVLPPRCAPRLPRREVWADEARSVLGDIGPYAVMHPGSGGRAKLWLPEQWAKLAAQLRPARVALTVGPADEGTIERVLEGFDDELPVVVHNRPVTTLAGVLAGATMFFGCDSGVTHLAAALGVPTVAVFGPTDPSVWGPKGDLVRILRGKDGTTASVTVEEAARAGQRMSGLI